MARHGCRSGKAGVFHASCLWTSVSRSDPLRLTAFSVPDSAFFTLPVFRAKSLNTVYRYKVGAQRTCVLRDDLTVSGQ